jgi:hypothetical protein
MLNVNEKNIFRIKGTFPSQGVRYFSLQSNNAGIGFPISTMKDYEIEPDDPINTRNPYASNDTALNVGTYTIYVTPRGNQGFPNELALCPSDWSDTKCKSMNAVMILRFYTSDPALSPANSNTDPPVGQPNPRLFGGENPPVVERRISTGLNGERSKDEYFVYTPCDQTRPTRTTSMITDYFSVLIPPWDDPVRHNKKDNFVLYLGEESSTAGVYPNLDITYLLATAWQNGADVPAGTRIVAKVTGLMPITAKNLHDDPKIANWQDYDVRYMSISTIAMLEGGPTCDTVDDAAFWRKFGPRWDRKYSIVVGEDIKGSCGLYNATTDLFLSTTLDGVAQDYWSIVDRQLVPKFTHTHEPDRTNAYARMKCAEEPDKKACVNPVYLTRVLGDFYPRVEWYLCKDGILSQPDSFKEPLQAI